MRRDVLRHQPGEHNPVRIQYRADIRERDPDVPACIPERSVDRWVIPPEQPLEFAIHLCIGVLTA